MPETTEAIPVPVLVVAGALGAGKTSLINAVLHADHGQALAVIVNDFGAIGIDEAILSAAGQPVVGLKNGCICCSLQGDLLRSLATVLSVGRPVDAVIIEASGVSDPRGIIQALHDPVLRAAVRLDAVVTVVDGEAHDAADDLWQAQLQAADLVVLSKTASLDAARRERLRAMIEDMGKALVFEADAAGGAPLGLLLGGALHPGRATVGDPPVIRDTRFVPMEWTSPRPLALSRFATALERLAPVLVRAKGLLRVHERPGQTLLFQMVGRRASLAPANLPAEGARLVLIGRAGLFDPIAAAGELDAMAASEGGGQSAFTRT